MPHHHLPRSSALALLGAAALPRPVRAQAATKIRVGVGVVESYAQGSYAQEMGFYQAAGLDADVETLINGGAITAAVIGGALDVGTTNSGSMALAHLRGFPIYLIAPSGIYTSASPTTVLVVAKDAPAQGPKDLNGKTIAVTTLGDLQQVAVMKWLDDGGADAKSVKFVEIHNGDLVPSILAKRVDASILLEPQLTDAKDQVRILADVYDAVAKELLISGWIVHQTWYERNLPTVRKFLAVMRQTADWANKNPRASAQILAKLTKIPLETVLKMNHNVYGANLDLGLVQPVIDALAKYAILPRGFPAAEMLPPKT
jgi:NitT/TauT family transport system substrate-binding protein